jgi:E3 ubiquitin-protein ligase HUWE1
LNAWKGNFVVEFEGEEGIDEGGLLKEWYILLSQQIFNESLCLFIKSAAGATYYPNPQSTV